MTSRETYDSVLARLDADNVLSWEEAHILDMARPPATGGTVKIDVLYEGGVATAFGNAGPVVHPDMRT